MRDEKKDRRVKYTKQQLKNSLVQLLADKPLYKISIKEICEIADINRSTFYAHYETQYDLYDEIIWDTTEDIKALIDKYPKKRNATESVRAFSDVLKYVEDNRALCLVLLSDKSNLTVGESLSTIMDKLNGGVLPAESADSESAVQEVFDSYISLFVISGTASIIWKWLNTEDRISANALAHIICGLSVRGIRGVSKAKRHGSISV